MFPLAIQRRALFILAGSSVLFGTSGIAAGAPSFPTRRVRLVVSFPAGGLADVLSRLLQPHLTEAFRQSIIVDNMGGAAGNVAGSDVVRNGADGHTFLVTVSTIQSVNPLIFRDMPFNPQRDLQPVALLANSQLFLITRPTLAPNSLREFLDHARANPDQLRYGSAGVGTTPHLAGELLKHSAGITATHVPYRGAAPMIQDVMAGHIDFAFAPGTVFPSFRAGKLKMLAVASRQRAPSAPDMPTFSELGVRDVYADTLFGIYAPSHVAVAVVDRMNQEVNSILALPEIRARFREQGAEAMPLRATEFRSMVQAEMTLFGDIVRRLGITAN